MENLYIHLGSFFIATLLMIVYFFKKKLINVETKLFSLLLIFNFIDIILMTLLICIGKGYFGSDSLALILNRIDFIMYLGWSWIFFIYILYITFYKGNNENKTFSIFLKVSAMFNLIILLCLFVLPISLFKEGNIMYAYGSAPNLLYSICACYFVLIIFVVLLKIKSVFNKKYIPLLFLIFLGSLILYIRQVDPGLLLISSLICYINLIMFFTIENPDLRLINELEIARVNADKSNRAKSDFLSSMSHEIRTPLNAIVGLSEYIKSSDDINDKHKEDLEDIINASNTLLEIVGNILDINKIESNKLEISKIRYNPKLELSKIIKMNNNRAVDKALKFNVFIAEDIPYELIGDKIHMKSILNNLLSNAIKYTEQGEINVTINCINKDNISTLIITVRDTGRGIKSELINRLFNKFDRLDAEKNSTTEGTGLGLAITKSIVDLMGGKINVQSSYGKGSVFLVQIPQLISKLESEEELEIIGDYSKKDYDNLNNLKKILIVDDNKLNIKVASKLLEGVNIEIDECYSGNECISLVEKNNYDLILLDIMMPGLNGNEVLLKLKENKDFNIPVVALTADAIAGAREKYIKEGFVDYISKPINKDQLITIIKNDF